jgi:hypothetical protein
VFPAAVTAVFFAVALVGVLHHEMWRDEIEIWMIATASSSLGELFHNIRTQPHPPLWYLVTWVLARFTSEPRAMQLLSLAVGTATVYLFARFAPLPRLHRVLFCFGYFPLFEYTLISRSYGLDLLLAVLFCVLYRDRDGGRYPALAVTLVLMANVHLLGTVIAGLLFLLLLADAIPRSRAVRAGGRTRVSLAAAAAGIAFALGEGLLNLSHMGGGHVRRATAVLDGLAESVSSLYYTYLPIPDVFERSFWNTNLIERLPDRLAAPLAVTLSLALLAASAAALRRSRLLLSLYLGGVVVMLAVFTEKSSGYLRHFGHLGILFVALLWLSATRAARPRAVSGAGAVVLGAVLSLHLASAAFAYGVDFAYAFSASADASRFVAGREDLSDAILVGSLDYTSQPFAAYLGKPVFYPDQRRFATFMEWGPERHVVRYKQVVADAAALARAHRKPVVLILDYDPRLKGVGASCRVDDELELELLASFPCAVVSEESYWLALLRPAAAAESVPGAPAIKRCIYGRRVSFGPQVERRAIGADADRPLRHRRAARQAEAAASGSSSDWRLARCAAEP